MRESGGECGGHCRPFSQLASKLIMQIALIRHSHHEPASQACRMGPNCRKGKRKWLVRPHTSQAPTSYKPTPSHQFRAVPGAMPSRKAEVDASPTPNEPSVSFFSKPGAVSSEQAAEGSRAIRPSPTPTVKPEIADLTEIQRERALEIWRE